MRQSSDPRAIQHDHPRFLAHRTAVDSPDGWQEVPEYFRTCDGTGDLPDSLAIGGGGVDDLVQKVADDSSMIALSNADCRGRC